MDLAEPAVDEREESLKAALGELGQRDFWPLAVQDILTIKARYPQGVQVCGQALAGGLTVIRRRTAHLNDPDLKGRAAAVRVSVKRQDSAVASTGRPPGTGAHRERRIGPAAPPVTRKFGGIAQSRTARTIAAALPPVCPTAASTSATASSASRGGISVTVPSWQPPRPALAHASHVLSFDTEL